MNAPLTRFTPLQDTSHVQNFLAQGGVIVGVDVDTQHDFATEGGTLYVPTSDTVKANLATLVDNIRYRIGSVDSHAFDAWEFQTNGGPFPEHCMKGTSGWLKIPATQRGHQRFIPMSQGNVVTGESVRGEGNRIYGPEQFADEVVHQGVTGLFEKEVYSLFANPNAQNFIEALVQKLQAERNITREQILFAVYGHCTGGYCVDGAAEGLREQGYNTAIIEDATAPLDISQAGKPQDGAEVTRLNALQNDIHILQTHSLFPTL